MKEINKTATIRSSFTWKVNKPGKKPVAKGVNRFKKSRDPNLANQEVREVYSLDRTNDRWDQIVTDVSSGKVIHEEHVPLSMKDRKSTSG